MPYLSPRGSSAALRQEARRPGSRERCGAPGGGLVGCLVVAGSRGAMAGLMAEVVEDHVRTHLVDAEKHPGALNVEAAEQLLEVVRTYLK